MLRLVVSSINAAVPFQTEFSSGIAWKAVGFTVHPDGMDKTDGLFYKTAQEAKSAAQAWLNAPLAIAKEVEKAAKKAARRQEGAVKKAERTAEQITKSLERAAAKRAEKLAAEEAILVAKKEWLDKSLETGTFSLVG